MRIASETLTHAYHNTDHLFPRQFRAVGVPFSRRSLAEARLDAKHRIARLYDQGQISKDEYQALKEAITETVLNTGIKIIEEQLKYLQPYQINNNSDSGHAIGGHAYPTPASSSAST